MQVQNNTHPYIATPRQCLVEQQERLNVPLTTFIPQLYLVDGKANVIKANGVNEHNVAFGEECCAFFTPLVTLAQPMSNVGSAFNFKWSKLGGRWFYRLAFWLACRSQHKHQKNEKVLLHGN